jgi:euchromatic histone-lysine N-methyltransferase
LFQHREVVGINVETPNRRRDHIRNHIRVDMREATLMMKRLSWLHLDKRIDEPVPGVYVGDLFLFRMELCMVGLYMQNQASIHYLPKSKSSNGESWRTGKEFLKANMGS